MQAERKGAEIELAVIGSKATAFLTTAAQSSRSGFWFGWFPSLKTWSVLLAWCWRNTMKVNWTVCIRFQQVCNTMVSATNDRSIATLPKSESEEMQRPFMGLHLWAWTKASTWMRFLVRFIESQVYQGVVENLACEQGAWMIAMKGCNW